MSWSIFAIELDFFVLEMTSQIFLYVVEHVLRDPDAFSADPGQNDGVGVVTHSGHCLNYLVAPRRNEDPLGAPIFGVGAAFNLTAGLKTINEAADRDFSYVE